MHLRIFISGFLILALVPASSFGAICSASCQMAALPRMPAHCMEPSDNSSPADTPAHQHQGISKNHGASKKVSHLNGGAAQRRPKQFPLSHTCCNGNANAVSSPCLSSETQVFQDQTISPAFRVGFGLLPTHGPGLLIVSEQPTRHAASNALVLSAFSRSLTLRI